MARKSYKTVNINQDLAQWIDNLVTGTGNQRLPNPLGITSRDEFVRIACALLAASFHDPDLGDIPADQFAWMAKELRRRREERGMANASGRQVESP